METANKKPYERHSGTFTSDSARRAIRMRWGIIKRPHARDVKYIGYVIQEGDTIRLVKLHTPLPKPRKRARVEPVTKEDLRRVAAWVLSENTKLKGGKVVHKRRKSRRKTAAHDTLQTKVRRHKRALSKKKTIDNSKSNVEQIVDGT